MGGREQCEPSRRGQRPSRSRGSVSCSVRRVILLLTNSFDLEDGFLTASNLEQVKGYLASTYPGQYSKVFPLIKNCSLEAELDTVRPWQEFSSLLLFQEKGERTPPFPGCCPGTLVPLGPPCPFFLFLFNVKKAERTKNHRTGTHVSSSLEEQL